LEVRWRLGHPRIVAYEVAQRPIGAATHTDPWRHDDILIWHGSACPNRERRSREIAPVLAPTDGERETQLPRPVGKLDVASRTWTTRAHEIKASHGLDRANEHGARLVLGTRDGVHTPVHAVDEIDVCDTRRSVERRRSRGSARGSVACEIVLADVR